MSCHAPPADNSRQIRALESRVRVLEKEVAGIKELTGVCMSAPDMIVPLYSAVYDGTTGTFTVIFASTPGEVYQVQQSADGVAWEVANPASVTGAAATPPATEPPVLTVWVSTDVWALDDLPVYFRVRAIPKALLCAPSKPC